MKKITSLCFALLLALTCATQVQAQSFNWGIVAGFNLTKLHLSGNARHLPEHTFKSDNRAGWYVGPKVTFNTALGIGVDAAVQYSERDLDINGESEKYRTFEIPVNLRYNIGLGKTAGIYLATGPQFGFALQNMSWDQFGSGYNFDRSNMNMTWNVGAGVRLLGHLEIGIGYNFGIGKTGKAIIENITDIAGESRDWQLRYRTNTFQVQLAYLF